ncbi:hypothetical protein HY633_01215 [Candidatus Uhrbacteria bacterium]|nr:hypothetical protein [Candidatus Uhrbacteria bacterium]
MYFFILGSHPALSAAEILAYLGDRAVVVDASRDGLLLDIAEFDPAAAMRRLGGTIKIAEVLAEEKLDPPAIIKRIADLLTEKSTDERITFGISVYGASREAAQNLIKLGMGVKNRLKEAGHSARWVRPQEGAALSSVSVVKNKILEEGAEILIFVKKDRAYLASTVAVQPFEEFSEIDYGRPARDMDQGMLPPKLARLMVNLGSAPLDGQIFDPFCGSGTVLTEALRMGYAKVAGGDKNPVAITGTERNIAWLREKGLIPKDGHAPTVFVADARKVGQFITDASLDAIVTEPFLGPTLKGRETRGVIQKLIHELSTLYYESMSAWQRLLKPGATIIVALPHYVMKEERHGFSIKEFAKLGYESMPLLSPSLLAKLGENATKNQGLLYGRTGQHVWREIVKLRRK